MLAWHRPSIKSKTGKALMMCNAIRSAAVQARELADLLDGYLNSPQQVALGEELRSVLDSALAAAPAPQPNPQAWIQELIRAWNEAYPRMDIDAKPGTLVMFDGRGGYEAEQKHAREVLKMRGLYEVEYTEVGGCSTAVKLRGVDGRFNSVLFAASPSTQHDGPSAFRDAVLEEAAAKADALDCAHRCGVGSEVGAAIRGMKGQPWTR